MQPTRPCTDEWVDINSELAAVYSQWKDGAKFRRFPHHWNDIIQLEPKPPTSNPVLLNLLKLGVPLSRCEHVSITLSGRAEYVYDTPTGTAIDIGLPGHHNVDSGAGYLPMLPFSRELSNGHSSCCIVQKPGAYRLSIFSFEVVENEDLTSPADFVHYFKGKNERETEHDLKTGHKIVGSAIVGRRGR